jgi:hypothetical protein
MKKQQGAAIIVVMALVVFLGLLGFAHQYQTRQMQLRTAMAVDRAAALVTARSIEVEVDFAMLTSNWVGSESGSEDLIYVSNEPISLPDFDGSETRLKNVVLRIQDEAGLMPLSESTIENGFVKTLLSQIAISDPRNAMSYQQLQNQLSLLTRSPSRVPKVVELSTLFSVQSLHTDGLMRAGSLLTNAPVNHFNPLTAPLPVLRSRLLPEEARAITTLRNRGELNRATMWRVIDIDKYDGFLLFPGPFFTVEAEVFVGSARIVSRRVVGYRPHSLEPIAIWSQYQPFPINTNWLR